MVYTISHKKGHVIVGVLLAIVMLMDSGDDSRSVSHGDLLIADLRDQLGVSEVTIREDLKHLESRGVLTRVRGGAVVAREHYGARGWVVHHNFDVWRGAAPINNANHGIWPTGGAWMCQHLWWHYQFGGDKQFLAQRAYPVMKEASIFFVDFQNKMPVSVYTIL